MKKLTSSGRSRVIYILLGILTLFVGSMLVFCMIFGDQAQGDQWIKLRNNSDLPTLNVFLPKPAGGDGAVIVCPGGAYHHFTLCEKFPIGRWLAKNGITAFVLSYRLPLEYPYPATMNDACLAIRYVRAHADRWQINPQKIAIMGFSAGGHLASTIATHFDSHGQALDDPLSTISCRPNFQILMYPVITMKDPITHKGSKTCLLGLNPSPALVDDLSNELHVNKTTPPAFVYHANTDTIVPIKNSDLYVQSLRENGVPVRYVQVSLPNKNWGGHGIGLDPSWTEPLLVWLKQQGF